METHGDHQSNEEFEDNPQPASFPYCRRMLRLDVALKKQGLLSKAGLVDIGNIVPAAPGRMFSRCSSGLNVRGRYANRWPFPNVQEATD